VSIAPDVIELLGGPPPSAAVARAPFLIVDDREDPRYRELRHREFVVDQGLFCDHDRDEWDEHPETIVLTALSSLGDVRGGVRVHPCDASLGWWRGSRLVVDPSDPMRGSVGAALVRAACSRALDAGALRFDAHVQTAHVGFFERLGWHVARPLRVLGVPHMLMRWEVPRLADHARTHKAQLGDLVGSLLPRDRWLGDDGVPAPGCPAGTVLSTDAITPSMVERDPEWAGWCGMLVTANDLAAMGASFVGALDAVAGRDAGHVSRVIAGVRAGAEAFGLPVIGGHTQVGVPGALTVTGVGRASSPVPGGGGMPGDALWLSADLEGDWRPGYTGRQWDSTSRRSRDELAAMLATVARARPHAAKDASMAGIIGTIGMLAEASGCGAEIQMSAVPHPQDAGLADWLTCFPGFAMVISQPRSSPPPPSGPAASTRCGALTSEPGVRLRWPDGELTTAIPGGTVTGLGAAPA
jgi:putative N-acetyltransferase (TIGR04045 family)